MYVISLCICLADNLAFPCFIVVLLKTNICPDALIEKSTLRSLLQLVWQETCNMPLILWPELKHDLAIARELIFCRLSKLKSITTKLSNVFCSGLPR